MSVALRKIRAAGGRTPPRARSGHHLAVSRSDAPGTGRRSGGCRSVPRTPHAPKRCCPASWTWPAVAWQVGSEPRCRRTCRISPADAPGRGRCHVRPVKDAYIEATGVPSLRRTRRRRLPAPGLPAHAGGCDLVHGHPRRSVARGAPARAGTGAGRAAGFAPQSSTTYASATSQPRFTSPTAPTGSGTGSASPSPEAPDRLPAAPLPVPAVDPFRDTGVSQGSRPPPQGLRRSPASECRLTGQAG